MSFTDYIYAIIQNNKSSLQGGINAFIDTHKKREIEYSKQAFSKGRQRIKPEAFWELSQKVIEKFWFYNKCWGTPRKRRGRTPNIFNKSQKRVEHRGKIL